MIEKTAFPSRLPTGPLIARVAEISGLTTKSGGVLPEVTLVIPTFYSSDALHLALMSWVLTGELEKVDRVVLVDDGSKTPWNYRLMEEILADPLVKSGVAVKLSRPLSHGGVLDLLASSENILAPGRFVLFCDSDIEMVRPGMVKAMKQVLETTKDSVACGNFAPSVKFNVKMPFSDVTEWKSEVAISASCVMWDMEVWRRLARVFCCSEMWDIDKSIHWDTMAWISYEAVQRKLLLMKFKVSDYMRHWGAVSWSRVEGAALQGEADQRYEQIRARLLELGVHKSNLHEDRYIDHGEHEAWKSDITGKAVEVLE